MSKFPLQLRVTFGLAVVSILTLPSIAFSQTFDVNFSGTDSSNGVLLAVFGEITLDPSLPVGSAVSSSDLTFSVNGDETQLFSNPFASASAPTSLAWETDGNGNLFITRLDNSTSQLSFTNSNGVFFRSLVLGSGTNEHEIAYFNNFTSGSANVLLSSSSGPDGPNGFLVGTSSVPEPNSMVCLVTIGLLGTFRRSRRCST